MSSAVIRVIAFLLRVLDMILLLLPNAVTVLRLPVLLVGEGHLVLTLLDKVRCWLRLLALFIALSGQNRIDLPAVISRLLQSKVVLNLIVFTSIVLLVVLIFTKRLRLESLVFLFTFSIFPLIVSILA